MSCDTDGQVRCTSLRLYSRCVVLLASVAGCDSAYMVIGVAFTPHLHVTSSRAYACARHCSTLQSRRAHKPACGVPTGRIPDAVIWPEHSKHVEGIVKSANANNVVIIPFGGKRFTRTAFALLHPQRHGAVP